MGIHVGGAKGWWFVVLLAVTGVAVVASSKIIYAAGPKSGAKNHAPETLRQYAKQQAKKSAALAAQLNFKSAVANETTTVEGAKWSVVTFPSVKGGTSCGGIKIPGLPSQGGVRSLSIDCSRTSKLFTAGPTKPYEGWVGGAKGVEYVWGFAAPGVTSLGIELSDCTVVTVPVVKVAGGKSVFMYVAPTQSATSGPSPVAVIPRGAGGIRLKSADIGQLDTANKQWKVTNGSCGV